MKVLKRNHEQRNLIIFLILSMVYIQALYSLAQGQSIITLQAIEIFFKNNYITFTLAMTSIFMIARLKKHSDKILFMYLNLVSIKGFFILATSFNKLILGLNFVYLLFAFYFYILWEIEIAKASYKPKFNKNDLEKNSRFHLRGELVSLEENSRLNILVTNVDSSSCFAIIESEDSKTIISKLVHNGLYRLVLEYEGVKFTHLAELVSTYDNGIGLNFLNEKVPNSVLNWSDLYKVCLERSHFE
jgi:hypothetical protein